jgi:hypothetical protein
MDTTYDVRIYKTEVYRGARTTQPHGPVEDSPAALEKNLPQRRPGRRLPRRAARRRTQGRGVQR